MYIDLTITNKQSAKSESKSKLKCRLTFIKRVLPVKSLSRFRTVSKRWKSLIDSPEFIIHHSVNQTHQHHLLVRYSEADEYKWVSIVDDDSFPHHKFSPDVSPTVNLINNPSIIDCSHGLGCLCGRSAVHRKYQIVVWNPSIRKSVGILLDHQPSVLGFGVCPKTFEPKIFKSITSYTDWNWNVEVFTISSGVWRSIPMNIQSPPNDYEIRCGFHQVVIDGIIYSVSISSKPGFILSFDLTSEEFGKIDLPENLEREYLSISKLKESLAVLICNNFDRVCDVWMMIKNGDSNFSFEKLYTVSSWAHDG